MTLDEYDDLPWMVDRWRERARRDPSAELVVRMCAALSHASIPNLFAAIDAAARGADASAHVRFDADLRRWS